MNTLHPTIITCRYCYNCKHIAKPMIEYPCKECFPDKSRPKW